MIPFTYKVKEAPFRSETSMKSKSYERNHKNIDETHVLDEEKNDFDVWEYTIVFEPMHNFEKYLKRVGLSFSDREENFSGTVTNICLSRNNQLYFWYYDNAHYKAPPGNVELYELTPCEEMDNDSGCS